MKKWLALMVLALALGLVVAGCGDDEEDKGSGDEAAETQQDTGGATDTAVGTDTGEGGGGGETKVSIGDNFFEPQEISVTNGAKVTWTNEGSLPHTVTKTEGPGDQFDSGQVEPGSEFSTTVTATGTIQYVCTIHAGQSGSLKVE
jgi:plastocyanin